MRVARALRHFEAFGCTTRPLAYQGILTDFSKSLISEEDFLQTLDARLPVWRAEKLNSAWLKVPIEQLAYASLASQRGFKIHHSTACGSQVLLYKWLQDSEDKVPPYAPATQVGCAGFLLNDRNELLVVKEWTMVNGEKVPSKQWKLPGGLANAGESFLDCAARETTEETGIKCKALSVLSLWHRHDVEPFGKSDVYAVVRLEPLEKDETFTLCPEEISEATWYKLSDFLEFESHPLITKIIRELYDESSKSASTSKPKAEFVDLGVTFPGRPRYPTYFPRANSKLLHCSIKAIASDVDGTLLTSESKLHPKNAEAIKNIKDRLHFFPATGKCRAGAQKSLAAAFPEGLTRGVYVNGLVVYSDDDDVIFERTLEKNAVDTVLDMIPDHFDLVAYCRDSLFSLKDASRPRVTELYSKYNEPEPSFSDSFASLNINKLLLLGDPAFIADIRPHFETKLQGMASITQALPSMLEILPFGASKRLGVRAYCRHINCDEATELLAIGDGENDMDMLQHAALGIALENAKPNVRAVADVLVEHHDRAGAARAIDIARAFAAPIPSSSF